MGKAKRSHSTPWLCGGDSTDVAPVGLARKHELRATHVFVNPTTATTDDSSTGGASTKKQEEKKRQKSLLSLLTRGASTTWVLPNSARKEPTCSGSAGELPGSEQLEGEMEQRRREEEALRSGEEKDGNIGRWI